MIKSKRTKKEDLDTHKKDNPKFKYLDDLPSDAGFVAFGETINELFENCATALLSLIAKIKEIKKQREIKIRLENESVEGLLYDFLSTLISESEINELFFSKVKVQITKNEKRKFLLRAEAYGENQNQKKGLNLVKAITLHDFSINKKNNGYSAKIFVDL